MFDAILNRAPTAPVRFNPDIPPELQRIINQALEKNRERRYRSAGDIAADLRRLQRALDSSAQVPAQALPSMVPARAYVRPLLYAGIAVVATGLTISLLWHTRTHDAEPRIPRATEARRHASQAAPVPSQSQATNSQAATNTGRAKARPGGGLVPAQPGAGRDQPAAVNKPVVRSSTARATAPSRIISGIYSGNFEIAAPSSHVATTAVLVERSGVVSGCLRLSPPLGGGGPVHGVSQGAQILLTVFFAGGRTELQGQFRGDELQGQYTIVENGVLRRGAFSLRLQTTAVQSTSVDASNCPPVSY